jgi:hypothetical protein
MLESFLSEVKIDGVNNIQGRMGFVIPELQHIDYCGVTIYTTLLAVLRTLNIYSTESLG